MMRQRLLGTSQYHSFRLPSAPLAWLSLAFKNKHKLSVQSLRGGRKLEKSLVPWNRNVHSILHLLVIIFIDRDSWDPCLHHTERLAFTSLNEFLL